MRGIPDGAHVPGGLLRLRLVINHGAAFAAAGAAGNLIDRLFRAPAPLHGGVVDWLHVWFYGPTFNLADIWLRAGLLFAAAGWLWRRRPPAS